MRCLFIVAFISLFQPSLLEATPSRPTEQRQTAPLKWMLEDVLTEQDLPQIRKLKGHSERDLEKKFGKRCDHRGNKGGAIIVLYRCRQGFIIFLMKDDKVLDVTTLAK
jgi:hypothetical protein